MRADGTISSATSPPRPPLADQAEDLELGDQAPAAIAAAAELAGVHQLGQDLELAHRRRSVAVGPRPSSPIAGPPATLDLRRFLRI